jgi:hypothetical protein
MSSTDEIFEKLQDFLHQLERHTEGRRAFHIQMSRLERHLKEGHFKRACAASLRPLIEKHGATMFPLPNSDIVLITRTASPQDMASALTSVYKELKTSAVVASLRITPGVSDGFTVWYDLERDYSQLLSDVDALKAGTFQQKLESVSKPQPQSAAKKPAGKTRVQYVDVKMPEIDTAQRDLDPEMLLVLTKALKSVDVSSFVKQQKIMAIVEGHGSVPVMLHHHIPNDVIFDHLLKTTKLKANPWFEGYLSDFIAERVLHSDISLTNSQSLASGLSVSVEKVLSEAFDTFNQRLGDAARSKVVLDFALNDMLVNPVRFLSAKDKIKELGFRYSISNLDLVSFGWANKELLSADFVKIGYPKHISNYWLDSQRIMVLKTRLKDIGLAKFILEGCDSKDIIERGKAIGFTMFEGTAVE